MVKRRLVNLSGYEFIKLLSAYYWKSNNRAAGSLAGCFLLHSINVDVHAFLSNI